MIALRGQSTWRVFIIHVLSRRLPMPLSDVDVREHATLLLCAGVRRKTGAQRKKYL